MSFLRDLMFHLPRMGAASWGANLGGSPVVLDTDHHDWPEPQTIFMVPLDHWSDGTPATHEDSHRDPGVAHSITNSIRDDHATTLEEMQ
jgi:hypothetical protein